MAKRVVFSGKQQVHLESFDPQPLGARDVRIKTVCTLMSTGTENIVFNRLFDAGTHWDAWVQYPFYPGYCATGDVVEVGPEVAEHKVGDRVAVWDTHASEHVVQAERAFPVPTSIDPQSAVWFALAQIAFVGFRASKLRLGDDVLVIGSGPIGQMAVRWCAAAGCRVASLDPIASRLELAKRGGAAVTISSPAAESRTQVLESFRGKLPGVVIDSTGHASVFPAALSLVATHGRVVILGDTGSPDSQHLTSDLIRRGICVVGAHASLVDETWNNATITRLAFDLALRGRFDFKGLNSHTFKPEQVEQAYELANTARGTTMGIVFDWTGN